MSFICPKCGRNAFKMIAGTIDGAECLSCGAVTSFGEQAGDNDKRSHKSASKLKRRGGGAPVTVRGSTVFNEGS